MFEESPSTLRKIVNLKDKLPKDATVYIFDEWVSINDITAPRLWFNDDDICVMSPTKGKRILHPDMFVTVRYTLK